MGDLVSICTALRRLKILHVLTVRRGQMMRSIHFFDAIAGGEDAGNWRCGSYFPYCTTCIIDNNVINNVVTKSPKVIIIGGGFSGLSAAKHLLCNGIDDILILEARNRLGGRVTTKCIGDVTVELGAKKHGFPCGMPNPAVHLAGVDPSFRRWLDTDDVKRTLTRLDLDGMSTATVSRVLHIIDDVLRSMENIRSTNNSNVYGNMESVAGVRLRSVIQSFPVEDQEQVARLYTAVVKAACAGQPPLRETRDGGGVYMEVRDSDIKVTVGYYGSIAPYLEHVPESKIRLESPVSRVVWGCSLCPNRGMSGPPAVMVKTEQGDEHVADYALITLPLGVLKANAKSMFLPSLSAAKLDAIDDMAIEHVNLVYLSYAEPLRHWYRTDVHNVEACGWSNDVKTIRKLPDSDHVLEAIVAGEGAELMERLSDGEIVDGLTAIVAEAHPKLKRVPLVWQVVRSKWSSDPYCRGAMTGSNAQVQKVLSEPEPVIEGVKPVMFFGGDYTCPGMPSSVRAAKMSGVREAEKILNAIKHNDEFRVSTAVPTTST
ncbi:protein anon-37Cs-like [Adelges cooleyi]|uniref:protein anon-37Cs-like n=1 Tax=Adelges cooleyi TaxID=133065 RepID=UPI0021800966|nr:protein anon-37Cs-like [Adelges cooleyi]